MRPKYPDTTGSETKQNIDFTLDQDLYAAHGTESDERRREFCKEIRIYDLDIGAQHLMGDQLI